MEDSGSTRVEVVGAGVSSGSLALADASLEVSRGSPMLELASTSSVSSTSRMQSCCPTFAISPSCTRSSFTVPSNGLVISTLALSL